MLPTFNLPFFLFNTKILTFSLFQLISTFGFLALGVVLLCVSPVLSRVTWETVGSQPLDWYHEVVVENWTTLLFLPAVLGLCAVAIKSLLVLNFATRVVFNFLLVVLNIINGYLLRFFGVLLYSIAMKADFISISFLPAIRLRVNYTFEERLARLLALKSQYFSQVEILPEKLNNICNNSNLMQELLPSLQQLVNSLLVEKHATELLAKVPRSFWHRLGDFVYVNGVNILGWSVLFSGICFGGYTLYRIFYPSGVQVADVVALQQNNTEVVGTLSSVVRLNSENIDGLLAVQEESLSLIADSLSSNSLAFNASAALAAKVEGLPTRISLLEHQMEIASGLLQSLVDSNNSNAALLHAVMGLSAQTAPAGSSGVVALAGRVAGGAADGVVALAGAGGGVVALTGPAAPSPSAIIHVISSLLTG